MSKSKWRRLRKTKRNLRDNAPVAIDTPVYLNDNINILGTANINSNTFINGDLFINGGLSINGLNVTHQLTHPHNMCNPSMADLVMNELSSCGYSSTEISDAIASLIKMKRGY